MIAVDTTDLTRTCQNPTTAPTTDRGVFTAAGLVAAFEHAWAAIRDRHPEVPAAVLVVASGTATKHAKWGHFAAMRWQHGPTQLPEVLVSGEGLKRPVDEVLTTLLHEAAHGLADARSIQDTSRQGRWHNKKFAALATEVGLQPSKDDRLGWSPCTLPSATADHYRPVLDRLGAALSAWRHPEPDNPTGRRSNNNGSACTCLCNRRIRVSNSALEDGPILCGVCDTPFLPDDQPRETTMHSPLLDRCVARGMHLPVYDPTGRHHGGLPTFPYRFAPDGLFTRRQLRAKGLRPGGQDIAAQILWRKGKRVAYLYDITKALPKREATPAQLAAIGKALQARRTCTTCGQIQPYYIPRRYGECLDCAGVIAA